MTSSLDPADAGPSPVIVGIDGSPEAVHALSWVIAKSDVLGPVTPIHVLQQPTRAEIAARFGDDANRSAIRTAARAHLTEACGDTDPSLLERARIVEGHPGAALCAAAAEAALLVVGTRDRSKSAAGMLGSVSSYCAKHAPGPVAIVPAHVPADRPIRRVVVGVDGSDHSDRALRWALDHVADNGWVHAVGGLSSPNFVDGDLAPPVEVDLAPPVEVDLAPPVEVLEKRIRARVEESVSRVTGYPYDGPAVEVHAVAKNARLALREFAGTETDLLVVGARGVTAIPFLVLGSVSNAVSHHPRVPVVVVHGNGKV